MTSATPPPGPLVHLAGYDFPIASLARYVLKTIEETFSEAGVELPKRRLVTIGTVSVDDPLIAVMYGGVAVGPPGNEMSTPMRYDMSPRTASFNIELWRKTPALGANGTIPTSAQEQEAAEKIMHDSWLLLESAYKADQLGVGVIARVGVNEPQGEMSGASMSLEMQVP